ncbi:STAS domain [Popillia japonica]|uniref:STAS domain n=1 Tax=Popillia japonica TaxID=7064 RepID=A0AAW1M0J9_POPJA
MPMKLRNLSIRKSLIGLVPILEWAPKYNTHKLVSDLIAGVTVGLTVMPQSLAYATLAGLEPQYGLYSAFMGGFVYSVFGTCKDITIGPTALMALMTYQQIVNRSTDYAILLCFLSGIVQLLMSVLHLGVLVDFISIPVTVGFTSATSVIIAASQLKGLLGLKFSSSGFIDNISKVFQNLHNTRISDLSLGICSIALLLFLRKIKDMKLCGGAGKSTRQKYISRLLWLTSTARNALVVVGCSLIAYYCETSGIGSPFLLTGSVKQGMPTIQLPPFQTVVANRTVLFGEMLCDLGTSVVLVPVIAVLGNVAIAKAFASGQVIDATQELFTLSLCNVLGSFFSSMPITGSFSRSAVNHASGVQTPLGGVFTGVLVLLALGFLTPYFAYIPKASLAAIIICAVIFMIEYEVVKPMWRSNRKDLIPTFATFILCLGVGVELGILIGVLINIVFLLYPSARPKLTVGTQKLTDGREYLLVTPGNSILFPSIEFMRAQIAKIAVQSPHLPVVVDCTFILSIDFTAAKGLSSMIDEFIQRKQSLYFLNPSPEFVAIFKGAGQEEFQYINSSEDIPSFLDSKINEESSLLQFNPSSVELKEIRYSENEDLSLRKV